MSLEAAVHKMTGLPAMRFGLAGRGTIAAGMVADLVILDAERVQDNATYDTPDSPPSGIHTVMVNGQVVLSQGDYVDMHAGRRLKPDRS